ncbi:MAG: FAD-linked oxidase [Ectothiorhodospiraceae bacterium]|nr:FAD-linked oxidase [Ectothiorhodospiraceae bacterium]
MKVANWGNYPVVDAEVRNFRNVDELREILENGSSLIARGLGRCYGDSSLNETIISTSKWKRILDFDRQTGKVKCEAGVSLDDILKVFVPRGWFPAVTPGTKFVTIGGAIASDVHGKSHHVTGSFSNYVDDITIMLSDGRILTCSKELNADLFWSTCGGMGLTGVILEATISLIPIETSYIIQEVVKTKNIGEIMTLFEESEAWTYSMAWIDCLATGESLGRSVMMRGEHAKHEDLLSDRSRKQPLTLHKESSLNVPFNFPSFTLNGLSMKAFNTLYYAKAPAQYKKSIVHYDPFFYPLDAVHNWNRIYGKRGFVQYQFVLPKENSREGLPAILRKISEHGKGSFLAVLKLFGPQETVISFPMEGYALALDFPITKNLFPFLDSLDEMVQYYGGRIYLTKDARMSAETFRNGYPHLGMFEKSRTKFDREQKFESLQSKRLGL